MSIEIWLERIQRHIATGDHIAARAVADSALSRADLADSNRFSIMNALISVQHAAADLFPTVKFSELRATTEFGWHIANPCIHPTAEARHAWLRRVNYEGWLPNAPAFDPEGFIRTRLSRMDLDEDWQSQSVTSVEDTTNKASAPEFFIRGFEDARLFTWDDREYATCAMRNSHASGTVRQVLLTIEGTSIVRADPISDIEEGHQKNWMPVIGASDMLFVDSCFPRRIRKLDANTNTAPIIDRGPGHPFTHQFRGGTHLLPWQDGYLSVIHEAMQYPDGRRIYFHRFVRFDRNLHITHCSDQFRFALAGVEFACGMRQEDETLIVSFGVNDNRAFLGFFPIHEVAASLKSLEERADSPPETTSAKPQPSRSGIVSVTLAHRGRADRLDAALRSVLNAVDTCVVVNTDGSDEVNSVARSVLGANAVITQSPWPGNFAEARNTALAIADTHHPDWVMLLDSDEELLVSGSSLSSLLEDVPDDVHVLSVRHQDGTYTKPRLFRMPVSGKYVGATHEYFDGPPAEPLAGVTFREGSKTREELQTKLIRDLEILRRETSRRPLEARWWYYLGDTLNNLDRIQEAIEAFRTCAEVGGWPEESAWACYREATLWLAIDRPDLALERCAFGLSFSPVTAELAWLAGFASWKLNRTQEAIAWSNLAIVYGEYCGLAEDVSRIGFRHLPALFEGPFDVLRFAYRRAGDASAADHAESEFAKATALRIAKYGR